MEAIKLPPLRNAVLRELYQAFHQRDHKRVRDTIREYARAAAQQQRTQSKGK